MNIVIGHILETKENGRFAKIQGLQDEIFDNVLLLYPYGFMSNIGTSDSSLALVIYASISTTNAYAIPYDVLKQPSVEDGEVVIGNFKNTNKITYKKNGTIEIKASLADFSQDINAAGSYKVGNTQVLSTQAAAIPDATGGVTVDSEARTALNSLLAALRTHGIIAA